MNQSLGRIAASIPSAWRSIAGLLAGAALTLLIGWAFVSAAWSCPARTQVLTLVVDYPAPWAPNPWSDQNRRRIESLGGGAFQVRALPLLQDGSGGGGRSAAEETVRNAIERSPTGRPLLIYLCGHMAVNDLGQPCFIPPLALPSDASSWMPIADLLALLDRCQPVDQPRDVLLLVEGGKLATFWPAGISANRWTDAVVDLVTRRRTGVKSGGSRRYQLDVLASNSAPRPSIGSARLGGDVFTHFLVAALSGRWGADADRSGELDTDELRRFVVGKTRDWSRLTRGHPQVPLWRATDPKACRVIAESVAFDDSAKSNEASGRLSRPDAKVVHFATRSGTDSDTSDATRDLGMEEHRVDRVINRLAVDAWKMVKDSPRPEVARQTIAAMPPGTPVPTPMLAALASDDGLALWSDSARFVRLANAQIRWLQTLRACNDAIFPAAEMLTRAVDRSRRRCVDEAFLATDENADDGFETALAKFEATVGSHRIYLEELTRAEHLRTVAISRVPHWVGVAPTLLRRTLDRRTLEAIITLDRLLSRWEDPQTAWNLDGHQSLVSNTARVSDWETRWRTVRDRAIDQLRTVAPEKLPSGDLPLLFELASLCDTEDQRTEIEQRLEQIERVREANAIADTTDPVGVSTDSVSLGVWLDDAESGSDAARARSRLRELAASTIDDRRFRDLWRRVAALIADPEFAAATSAANDEHACFRLGAAATTAIDDFWAEPKDRGVPQFASAAQAFLAATDRSPPMSKRWEARRSAINQTMRCRINAAVAGIKIAGKAVRRASPDRGCDVVARIVSCREDRTGEPADFPSGKAAVEVIAANHRSVRRPIGVGDRRASSPQSVPLEWVPFESVPVPDRFTVGWTFRGHVFESALIRPRLHAAVTIANPSPAPVTRLTVLENPRRSRAMCFVLDCSASMHDAVAAEVSRGSGDGNAGSKWQAARRVILDLMRRLEVDDIELGLVLYGHRMAVGPADTGLMIQKRYHDAYPFSPSLQPFEDVELVLPTGRFDQPQWSIVENRLAVARPWGQTPLHLAIRRAIEDLAGRGDQAVKDVVVISDGRNYQFNPTPAAVVDQSVLIAEAERAGVRVHVIGFGIPGPDADVATTDFVAIAKGTKGQCFGSVSRASELVEHLDDLSRQPRFTVYTGDEKIAEAKLGDTIDLPSISRVNQTVSVQVGDTKTPVPVSPGDRIHLMSAPSGGRLRTAKYRDGNPRFASLVGPAGYASSAMVGIHQPRGPRTGPTFRLSFQRHDGKPADRPAATWVEVAPISPSDLMSSHDCYRISEFRWLPGMPCPIAEFDLAGWPEGISGYQVQAWCGAQEAWSAETKVNCVVDTTGQRRRLPGHPTIEYSAKLAGEVIWVNLFYPPTLNDRADQMLIVRSLDPKVRMTQQVYDPASRNGRFRFEIGQQQAGQALTMRLGVIPIETLKANCLRMTAPVIGQRIQAVASVPATVR